MPTMESTIRAAHADRSIHETTHPISDHRLLVANWSQHCGIRHEEGSGGSRLDYKAGQMTRVGILSLCSKGAIINPLLSHTNFVGASEPFTTNPLLFDDSSLALCMQELRQNSYIDCRALLDNFN